MSWTGFPTLTFMSYPPPLAPIYWSPNPGMCELWLYLEIRPLLIQSRENEVVRVALIQYEWWPYKKRGNMNRGMQWEHPVMTGAETRGDARASQGTQDWQPHQRLGTGKDGFHPESQREHGPTFRLVAFRIMSKYISVGSDSIKICGYVVRNPVVGTQHSLPPPVSYWVKFVTFLRSLIH